MKRVHVSNDGKIKWLDEIRSGRKTYEGRLSTKISEWDLHVGKQLILYDDYELLVEVTSLKTYANFVEAYHDLGEKLVPGIWSDDEIRLFYNFYPEDEVRRHAVVAIGIKVVKAINVT